MKAQKDLVREAFARAASHYDAVAAFQREAGRRLLDLSATIAPPRRVLDAGCGTGHGLALLARCWPASELLALDFAAPMLQQAGTRGAAVCADIEKLPLGGASIDLVWSNLALQWCDLDRAMNEFVRVLSAGGHLAATTLGPGTFVELRRAFYGVDAFRHTNDFIDEHVLRATLAKSGLLPVKLHREPVTVHYPDLRTLLASVRDLGANRVTSHLRRRGLMGKSAWQRFADNYARLATSQGLPLTYDTYFLLALKQ